MHRGERAQDHPVAHFHVPGNLRVVGEDGFVAHLAVVRQVGVGHHPIVVTQARDAAGLNGAQIESAKLANGVAVADVQLGGFTGVFFVLRRSA